MPFDLPLDQLQSYLPICNEPTEFDEFWSRTLKEARTFDLNPKFTPVDAGLPLLSARARR